MEDYEMMSLMGINSFVEKYDTQVSKAISRLMTERVFIDSTDVVVNRYENDYSVCIMLNYTLTKSDVRLICETLGDFYWTVTSAPHISGYMLRITDTEIHKYFDK